MGQTTEEILNSLTDEQIAAYTANPLTEEHIIVGDDRFIKVPEALKRIAVQFDHNIETVTFDCPRYWDGHDMSKMIIYINYMLPDNTKDCCLATNVAVDENDSNIMHFDWTISSKVTQKKGTISFLVCIKKTDGEGIEVNHWNSELNREMTVSEGLECEESILEQYPDLITQLLLKMESLGELLVITDDGNGNVFIKGLNTTLNIADAFSDMKQYAVGDYCMYLGTLYECITDITQPGPWRIGSWKEVNITDELKDCFQSVSNGKTLIASAITDKGIQTEATDDFEQMARNIRQITTGVQASGTAEPSDVTSGKTFINHTGSVLTGTSTAASDLSTAQSNYSSLQNSYNTLSAEKQALQNDYNALKDERDLIALTYYVYQTAVVEGMQYSGYGVTHETTPDEIKAILLATFPDVRVICSKGILSYGATASDNLVLENDKLYAKNKAEIGETKELTCYINNIDVSDYNKLYVTIQIYALASYGVNKLYYGVDAVGEHSLEYSVAGQEYNETRTLEFDVSGMTGAHSIQFKLHSVNSSSATGMLSMLNVGIDSITLGR